MIEELIKSIEWANFSFTFTISSKKIVYFKGKRRPYNMLTQDQQYEFLEKQLHRSNKHFDNIKWVYEEHEKEDNRLHVHGFVINACWEQMELFRSAFYGNPINIAYSGYIKLSNIQKTQLDISYFITYMDKNQNKIKYYMGQDQDKKLSCELNGEKFKPVLIESNISPQYLNSLEEHLESRDMGDDYKFGKKLNKFIVEI